MNKLTKPQFKKLVKDETAKVADDPAALAALLTKVVIHIIAEMSDKTTFDPL